MEPASFEVDGKRADRAVVLFERFPMDPVTIDRVEVINGVRWLARSMHAEIRNDRRSVRLYLEKISEDD